MSHSGQPDTAVSTEALRDLGFINEEIDLLLLSRHLLLKLSSAGGYADIRNQIRGGVIGPQPIDSFSLDNKLHNTLTSRGNGACNATVESVDDFDKSGVVAPDMHETRDESD